jgi:uncharacterized protein with von Willebrand factor type A (vWA) domain
MSWSRCDRPEDIDLDALGEHLGDQARVDARALAELQRELERQGLFDPVEGAVLAVEVCAGHGD